MEPLTRRANTQSEGSCVMAMVAGASSTRRSLRRQRRNSPQPGTTAGCLVPGLPIRDCARSCNTRDYTWLQLSAIEMKSKSFFERLYLVLGLSTFEPRVNCPFAPTPPPLAPKLFLDFRAIFFPSGPSFFVSTRCTKVIWPSPGTLARPLELRGSFLWNFVGRLLLARSICTTNFSHQHARRNRDFNY